MNFKLFRQAFIITLPVLAGYLALGTAFGVLFSQLKLPIFWAPIMSLTIYGGSMQISGVDMLQKHLPLLQILFLSIVINIRHIVYGLSLIDAYRGGGWRKFYLIFALTDETYALLTTLNLPEGANRHKFMVAIASLNHFYWIIGGLIGATLGNIFTFDSKGIDFSMTSIFVAILADYCKEKKNLIPIAISAVVVIISRIFFGMQLMLPAAVILVLVLLFIVRKKLILMFPEFEKSNL